MPMLTEEKATKPSLWDQAMKVVKGDSMTDMVEQFTQEMTLVAEGLCEDQARLRNAVDGLIREADGQRAKSEQDYQELLRQLGENHHQTQSRLDELSRRVSALEKSAVKPQKGLFNLGTDVISRVTVLAGMICGTWLMVTLLQLFI